MTMGKQAANSDGVGGGLVGMADFASRRKAGKAPVEIWLAKRWGVQPVVAWWAVQRSAPAWRSVVSCGSSIRNWRLQSDKERQEKPQKHNG